MNFQSRKVNCSQLSAEDPIKTTSNIISKLILASLLLTASTFANATATSKKVCEQRLGALDIGSGSTKAFAAVVDTCQHQILKVLFEEQAALPFNDAMEKSGTGEIPKELAESASLKISELVKQMRERKVEKISAISTSVFRKAKNGEAIAKFLAQKIGVPILTISQEQEAELGYASALAQLKIPANAKRRVIVWDIGGGSMQMLYKENGKANIYKGELASVSFKNKVISEIQKKDPKTASSPNPLGKNADAAADLAKDYASKNVPKEFTSKDKPTIWVGIGGVLANSAQNQIQKDAKSFTQKQLEQILKTRAQLNDDQIGGDYRSTEVTNLALVLGFMRALDIQQVDTAKVNLTQGWLLQQ